jgi:Carboxypeptidase regulatory-like domain/Bacterial Ig-like domain (group 2)
VSRLLSISLALAIALPTVACDDGPTGPDGPAVYIGCGQELDGYQCRAEYVLSGTSARQDVTGLATWSTSDSSVATIDSVGFVTVLRAGNVAIRATYRGVDGFLTMPLEAGGLRRYYRAVSGFVTDSQDGSKIAGVTVRILDGPNANRTTTTGSDGAYQLYDLELGTFTMRFSRSGYATVDRPFTLTGDKFNDASATLVRSTS